MGPIFPKRLLYENNNSLLVRCIICDVSRIPAQMPLCCIVVAIYLLAFSRGIYEALRYTSATEWTSHRLIGPIKDRVYSDTGLDW